MEFLGSLVSLGAQIALLVYLVRAISRARKDAVDASPTWYLWPFSTLSDGVGQILLSLGVALAAVAVELALRHFSLGSRPGYVLLGLAVATFGFGWWQRASIAMFSGVVAAFSWWTISATRWAHAGDHPAFVPVGVGVALLSLLAIVVARLLESRPENRRLAFFTWLPATMVVFGVLFALSSQAGIARLGEDLVSSPFTLSWKLALGLGALLAAVVALLATSAWRRATSPAETAALAVLALLALAISAWPPSDTVRGNDMPFGVPVLDGQATLTSTGVVWASAINVVLLLLLLGLVFLGYERREDWMVTLGAVLLFLFVLFKYFDWLFSLLDRSVAFVGAGLLFLGVGWLMERGRRSVLSAMDTGEPHDSVEAVPPAGAVPTADVMPPAGAISGADVMKEGENGPA